MRLRIASAVVLAPIALAAVAAGGWSTVAFVALAGILAANEWDRLCGGHGLRGGTGILLALVILVSTVLAGFGLYEASLAAGAVGMLALAGLALIQGRVTAWPAAGVLYLAVPTVALIWMRGADTGVEMLIWLLVIVWATDIAAIFAGKSIGGPKLWPRISPNKTWSGAIAGLLAAAVVGAITAALREKATLAIMIPLSVGLSAISQLGDLAESAIKRYYGVKDTGTLIPGHGGILDRIDGLLLALPAAAVIALLNEGSALIWP
jgi:phosphatidate cytidylyltransferase